MLAWFLEPWFLNSAWARSNSWLRYKDKLHPAWGGLDNQLPLLKRGWASLPSWHCHAGNPLCRKELLPDPLKERSSSFRCFIPCYTKHLLYIQNCLHKQVQPRPSFPLITTSAICSWCWCSSKSIWRHAGSCLRSPSPGAAPAAGILFGLPPSKLWKDPSAQRRGRWWTGRRLQAALFSTPPRLLLHTAISGWAMASLVPQIGQQPSGGAWAGLM